MPRRSSLAASLLALFLFVPAAANAATDETARRLGGVKGDEATYVGMAASLAFDGDLSFDGRDYARFREWYGSGPEGIFLKRDATGTLRFGKAYVYGLVAAPFVGVLNLAGLLFFNIACLVTMVMAGAWWLVREGSRPAVAALFSVLFLAASMTPIYAAWLTSDLLNFTLVFLAFVIGVRRHGPAPRWRFASAIALLALATFSKPLVLPLVAPLVLANAPWRSLPAVRAAAAYGLLVAALFGVNALITGDANYQGGDRKSFYGRFPFDEGAGTFDSTGIDVATDTVLTPVGAEGRLTTLLPNTGYFLAGRHFGLIPFGWTWLLAVGLWVFDDRSKRMWQAALAGALAAIALATLVWMPYTWSGAGGPIGNRYFLSVAGAVFVLMPPLRTWWGPALACLGLLFMWPSLRDPATAAKQPWVATRSPIFSVLPLEMTGASDLPIVLDQRRGRIPQGRDPQLSVALLDERADPGRGGWIAVDPGSEAALLIRSPARLGSSVVGVRSDAGCRVEVSTDAGPSEVTLGDRDRKDIEISMPQVFAHNIFATLLHVDARNCRQGVEVALQGRPVS